MLFGVLSAPTTVLCTTNASNAAATHTGPLVSLMLTWNSVTATKIGRMQLSNQQCTFCLGQERFCGLNAVDEELDPMLRSLLFQDKIGLRRA